MELTTQQQLYVVLFLVFCGAFYQFANPDETLKLPISRRLGTALFSLVIIGAGAAYFIINLQWNMFLIGIVGSLLAAIADVFFRLWLTYNRQSKGLLDFIKRLRSAYDLTQTNKPGAPDEPAKPPIP